MSRQLTIRLLWAITLAFWAFIFLMTHIPQQRLPDIHVGDKSAHLISYGVLASLMYVTMWRGGPGDWALVWKIPVFLLAYGAFDEQTQKLVNRSCELADWYADAVGVLVAVGVWSGVRLLVQWRHVRVGQHGQTRTSLPMPPGDL
jgi:VanZ family protein